MHNKKVKEIELRKTKLAEILNKNKKKKIGLNKIFEKAPKNSHVMPNGNVMSGKTHSKGSKKLGKMKKQKKKTKPIFKNKSY